jgi:hypothetical protein
MRGPTLVHANSRGIRLRVQAERPEFEKRVLESNTHASNANIDSRDDDYDVIRVRSHVRATSASHAPRAHTNASAHDSDCDVIRREHLALLDAAVRRRSSRRSARSRALARTEVRPVGDADLRAGAPCRHRASLTRTRHATRRPRGRRGRRRRDGDGRRRRLVRITAEHRNGLPAAHRGFRAQDLSLFRRRARLLVMLARRDDVEAVFGAMLGDRHETIGERAVAGDVQIAVGKALETLMHRAGTRAERHEQHATKTAERSRGGVATKFLEHRAAY